MAAWQGAWGCRWFSEMPGRGSRRSLEGRKRRPRVLLEGRAALRRLLSLAARRRLRAPTPCARFCRRGGKLLQPRPASAWPAGCFKPPGHCARFCQRGASPSAVCCRWRPSGYLGPRRPAQGFAGEARACCVSRMRARAAGRVKLANPCEEFCWKRASLRAGW